jgi:hypothetical protein
VPTISSGKSSANCGSRGRLDIRLSPVRACVECGAPIDPIQGATTAAVCGRLPCVVAASASQVDEQRAMDEERVRRARAALEAEGHRPFEVSWSLVPENRAVPTSLPPGATDDFLAHLRRVTEEASDEGSLGDPPPRTGAHPTAAEASAFARACTACRGWCCRGGGTHAFLDAASIRRIRAEEDLDASELEGQYLSRLQPTHLEGGCLFQGQTGCRLPRTLRSDTCNDWLCEDLTATRVDWREKGGPPLDQHFVPITRGKPRQPSSP